MLNSAFEPWPSFTQAEADAVSKVLLSNKVNYWTGQECREFEKEFAQFAGTKHAVAVANGTVALDVALKALGIGAGDDVIVTSRTFLASASSIVTAGANPVLPMLSWIHRIFHAVPLKLYLLRKPKPLFVYIWRVGCVIWIRSCSWLRKRDLGHRRLCSSPWCIL